MHALRRTLSVLLLLAILPACAGTEPIAQYPALTAWPASPTPYEVLAGLRAFYNKTARPDGSFSPGIDPDYLGMSDCAYSDMAAVTYACTVHKTFGWTLPHEEKTIAFLQSRQKETGDFFNVAGTIDPASPEGRVYNTTQGLVALHALGAKPKYDALLLFEEIVKGDHKSLPPYSTSFFPLAYLCAGKAIPEKVDRGIRALMVQDREGYLNDHIAATYHASHYYALVGEPTPKSREMVIRVLRDQAIDGSWFVNMPSRDRHATFDAVFTLKHEGASDPRSEEAIRRAAIWALSCRNEDGGFGHFPGSTSDADAIYFHVGTLVMAGFLDPADRLPPNPHLLSWGHMMPVERPRHSAPMISFSAEGDTWIRSRGTAYFVGEATSKSILATVEGTVFAAALSSDRDWIAVGRRDFGCDIYRVLNGSDPAVAVKGRHRGAITSIAFSPDQSMLATASIDGTIKLWDAKTGNLIRTLTGHKSWVNSVAWHKDGNWLVTGSSDGTVRIWDAKTGDVLHDFAMTKAEVRSVAVSNNGKLIAAGERYGMVKVWDTETWQERYTLKENSGDVWAVAFSPDSKTLAAGDGQWNRPCLIRLFDAATGKPSGTLQHTGEVLSLAFSPDGQWLSAGGGDKAVHLWQMKE
ncbi:MAG: prenyltransferase/squalene oxidase repeat-containing protein [Phycisphaeraceae bacterium]